MNHLGALRVSLLLAIGVVPVACGGTVNKGDDGDDNSSSGSGGSGSGGSGSGNAAGSKASAGKPSVGNAGSGGTVGKMVPPTGGFGGETALPPAPTCTSPKVDPLSGLVRCREGYVHRPERTRCEGFGGQPAEAGGGAGGAEGLPRAGDEVVCEDVGAGGAGHEGICEQFELGFCRGGDGLELATCDSGCFTDEDCRLGTLCECGHPESPSGGVCVGARNCTTDADCGPTNLCAAYDGPCGEHAFACFSPEDECRSSADCGGSSCGYQGFRACDDAVCGRPFLVENLARVAPLVSSDDWRETRPAPHLAHLTAQERESLARHWARMGQMEHASIAAFARFSLQLLSLGAPPDLVEACTRALADETAHTKLCFELASAYAGRALGPGKLDVDNSLAVTSLGDVVELVIAEGCFGETVAALEAREAADTAADPVIRAAYSQIARDEQRHAELAFQFIRWALEQDRAAVRDRIAIALHASEARPDVLRAVVEPCFAALLAQAA
jgi:hypothetical protein